MSVNRIASTPPTKTKITDISINTNPYFYYNQQKQERYSSAYSVPLTSAPFTGYLEDDLTSSKSKFTDEPQKS